MYYKDGKKIKYILVFSSFLSFEPERKEEERRLGMRMSTSFLARWISTRKGMAREVRNPVHKGVDRGRGEAANTFKIGEKLHKSQRVSP